MRNLRIAALTCLVVISSFSVARAALIVQLLNHPAAFPAEESQKYGLRIDYDDATLQTFNFDPVAAPGAAVYMSFDTVGGDTAKIYGTVKHNQSGQLWAIEANISSHLFTNLDASKWNASDSLYDEVVDDMMAKAANVNASGENSMKDLGFAADRLGWFDLTLNMQLVGPGPAVFEIAGQPNGKVTMYDTPQGAGMLPFMLVKGFRLGDLSNDLAGIGWLSPMPPDEQDPNKPMTEARQDFFFKVGPTVPEPSSVVLALLGGLGLALARCFRRS